MSSNNSDLEKRLWEAADQLRANSGLKSSEYSTPVLGLIFLKYADFKFSRVKEHKKNPNTEISIYGQEIRLETIRLCKMNFAVHGLEGDIKQGNSYYEDL